MNKKKPRMIAIEEKFFRDIEWGTEDICPLCLALKSFGQHTPECSIGQILGGEKVSPDEVSP
jgi:hypothetical protein